MPMMGKQRLLFADRVCAVVATSSAHKALRQLREARRYTRTIELRLDWLRSDSEKQISSRIAALPRQWAHTDCDLPTHSWRRQAQRGRGGRALLANAVAQGWMRVVRYRS